MYMLKDFDKLPEEMKTDIKGEILLHGDLKLINDLSNVGSNIRNPGFHVESYPFDKAQKAIKTLTSDGLFTRFIESLTPLTKKQ